MMPANETFALPTTETHDLIGEDVIETPTEHVDDDGNVVRGTMVHRLPRWRKKG